MATKGAVLDAPRETICVLLAGFYTPPAEWELATRHLLATIDDEPSARGGRQPDDASRETTQCRVLVVDDDLTIRETVSILLEDEGYLVEQAANGLEALACVERARPRVVLLDMRMPVMDGWGFAAELRARNIDVPLVAMTATRDARTWAEQIGAATYLGKPFGPNELLEIVARLCSGSIGS